MKRLVLTLTLPLLFATATAFAESPITGGVGCDTARNSAESYEQAMRHYQSPQSIVRAKAEFRAGTADATHRVDEVVRLLEQPAASQQRSLPQRLRAALGGEPRLLSVPLERRQPVGKWIVDSG